eukprot:scaffold106_cov380-Prasinococcus_capsulatus_cf.AAC.51
MKVHRTPTRACLQSPRDLGGMSNRRVVTGTSPSSRRRTYRADDSSCPPPPEGRDGYAEAGARHLKTQAEAPMAQGGARQVYRGACSPPQRQPLQAD